MDSNRRLYYFTVVAETLNFTQAAQVLFISQQALSKHIKRLEDEYSSKLFERKPKLQLTAAGKRFLQYATSVLQEETNLNIDLQTITDGIKCERIIASLVEKRASILLPGIYHAFRSMNRQIILSFVNSGYVTASKLLQTASITLYFGLLESCVQYGKQVPLMDEQLYLMAPKSLIRCLPAVEQQRIHDFVERGVELKHLCSWNLPWIMPYGGGKIASFLRSHFQAHSYVPNIATECYPFDTTLQLCELGAGITLVFRSDLYASIEVINWDKIFILPLANIHEQFTLGLVTYPDAMITRSIQAYVDCAVKIASEISAQMDTFFPHHCHMQFPL